MISLEHLERCISLFVSRVHSSSRRNGESLDFKDDSHTRINKTLYVMKDTGYIHTENSVRSFK